MGRLSRICTHRHPVKLRESVGFPSIYLCQHVLPRLRAHACAVRFVETDGFLGKA